MTVIAGTQCAALSGLGHVWVLRPRAALAALALPWAFMSLPFRQKFISPKGWHITAQGNALGS